MLPFKWLNNLLHYVTISVCFVFVCLPVFVPIVWPKLEQGSVVAEDFEAIKKSSFACILLFAAHGKETTLVMQIR